eukprot:1223078-Prymnesium_polylepis.1
MQRSGRRVAHSRTCVAHAAARKTCVTHAAARNQPRAVRVPGAGCGLSVPLVTRAPHCRRSRLPPSSVACRDLGSKSSRPKTSRSC